MVFPVIELRTPEDLIIGRTAANPSPKNQFTSAGAPGSDYWKAEKHRGPEVFQTIVRLGRCPRGAMWRDGVNALSILAFQPFSFFPLLTAAPHFAPPELRPNLTVASIASEFPAV